MYLMMLGIAAVFAVMGYFDRNADKRLFCIELFLMGAMLCLRYGQGTDYFGYEANYSLVPKNIDMHFLFHNGIHGEVGYTFIAEIFRSLGAPFPIFVAVLSLAMMLMTYHGIKRYHGIKTIAVLLLYPTYYLTFYYGIRQGFALAFTLYFILPAYVKEKKLKYVFLVCFCATMHKSVLILLLPLFVDKIVKKCERLILFGAIAAGVMLGLFLRTTGFTWSYVYFSPSYSAIALRVILFIAIVRLYRCSGKKDEISNRIFRFYFIGFCIYLALCPAGFVAHRVTAYMKFSEIILFSRLLANRNEMMHVGRTMRTLKRYVCLLVIMICMVEGVKNINSYIGQGEYYSGIHFYNYPYVSVFNKKDIYKYRENEFLQVFPDVFQY
ncbi:MAG: EpsG family protein [Lachnospiraceae bacterium]|jgi:hypothetical protein|nr:EpsG family protein [Lachnospiraceae bacterium]